MLPCCIFGCYSFYIYRNCNNNKESTSFVDTDTFDVKYPKQLSDTQINQLKEIL